MNLINIKNDDFKIACKRVYNKVINSLDDIERMIFSIPESYNGMTIMTNSRKKYYFETFKIRLENILKKCI